MIRFEWHDTVGWTEWVMNPLEAQIQEQMDEGYRKYDWLRDEARGEVTPEVAQVDGYLYGLERLLVWEG